MHSTKRLLAGLIAAGLLVAAGVAAAADKMSHAHMGHVMSGWNDTPGEAGLLPTAEAEAEIALQHATLATEKTDDLAWMQMHVAHVLHAVDPSVEPRGPGKGYGLIKAATGVSQHIGFAAASDDASPTVRLHAEHVSASADNVVERAQEIVAIAKMVAAAKTAGEARAGVAEIYALSLHIVEGYDADGDGQITWHDEEGGLAQVRAHMGFMMDGEGLS